MLRGAGGEGRIDFMRVAQKLRGRSDDDDERADVRPANGPARDECMEPVEPDSAENGDSEWPPCHEPGVGPEHVHTRREVEDEPRCWGTDRDDEDRCAQRDPIRHAASRRPNNAKMARTMVAVPANAKRPFSAGRAQRGVCRYERGQEPRRRRKTMMCEVGVAQPGARAVKQHLGRRQQDGRSEPERRCGTHDEVHESTYGHGAVPTQRRGDRRSQTDAERDVPRDECEQHVHRYQRQRQDERRGSRPTQVPASHCPQHEEDSRRDERHERRDHFEVQPRDVPRGEHPRDGGEDRSPPLECELSSERVPASPPPTRKVNENRSCASPAR